MTLRELDKSYFTITEKKKKKGANKGYKVTYTRVWSDGAIPRQYIDDMASIDSHGCGLFLCKCELTDLMSDKWWDVPNYRDSHLQDYRRKITSIKKQYGLTNADVREFMRVA